MEPGYILNKRYQIIRTLGEGGMANVYLANDLVEHRQVTIKVLRLDLQTDESALRRFKREAKALSELDNENIVKIYDISQSNDGLQFLVMEYIEGTDLKEYIKENYPLKFETVVQIMDQILSAVSYAHKQNIIHRDLKPKNILIDKNNVVKITDFGISMATTESTLTQTNSMLGSVHYISPEQARGSMITKQSDIYSLGIVLFELLVGHVPYQGETAISVALKHYKSKIPSVKKIDPKIPQALENVILHATSKSLSDRYQTVAAMRDDLRTTLNEERKEEKIWRPQILIEEETKIIPQINHEDEMIEDDTIELPIKKKYVVPENISLREVLKQKYSRKEVGIFLGAISFITVVITVIIFAITTTPKVISMPDIRGLSKSQATEILDSHKLSLGQVKYQYSSDYNYGQIIKSFPKKDKKVRQQTAINVIISKGPDAKKFGDYRGQNYQAVKKRLEKQGVHVYEEEKYTDSAETGAILKQSISQKEKVVMSETTVTFTISKGPTYFKVRMLSGMSKDQIDAYAQSEGIKVVYQYEYSDTIAENQVIKQGPAPNATMYRGQTLIVILSRGKVLGNENSNSKEKFNQGEGNNRESESLNSTSNSLSQLQQK